MIVQKVTDKSFGKYGRVLDGYALSLKDTQENIRKSQPVIQETNLPYNSP